MTHDTTRKRKIRFSFRWAVILAVLLSTAYLGALKFSYSAQGSLRLLETAQALCGVLTLVSLIGVLSVAPFMLLPSLKGKSPLDPRIPAVFFIAAVLSLINGQQLRMQELRALAKKSQPLIAAIKSYTKESGQPPTSLADLVPRYFPTIPKTGMGAYPRYEYDVMDTKTGKQWEVKIPCSVGFLQWSLLFYRSTEKYDSTEHGGTVQRIGNWAFIND